MPVTSLWRVTGDVAAVIDYTMDERKTEYAISSLDVTAEELAQPLNAALDRKTVAETMEQQGGTDGEICVSDLHSVTDYAMRGNATVWQDAAGIPHRLVTGINCDPELAVEQMRAVKKQFGKMGGTIAYHGYQSFADGEGPPDLIHQIGVETARQLWGDRYQVLVTTHIDHANHLHNHFVVNTVSFIDGIKYRRTKQDYWKFRTVSDELARSYGFYVIETPGHRAVRDYTPGKTSWRKIVKADLDEVIAQAKTEDHFYSLLHAKGYELKTSGKDVSVRAPGAQRFLRLERNFGPEYSRAAIRRQIVSRWVPKVQRTPVKKMYYRGSFSRRTRPRKYHGIQALYIRYCFLLGAIPKKRHRSVAKVSPDLKKELLKLDRLSAQTRMLCRNHISTTADLTAYQKQLSDSIETLTTKRGELYRMRRTTAVKLDPERMQEVTQQMGALSTELYTLRKELRLCNEVQQTSEEVKQKVQAENQRQQEQKRADQTRSRRSAFRFGIRF